MYSLVRVCAFTAASFCIVSASEAKVQITVDLDEQTIHVESKDKTYDWKVSSGKDGYETPAGTFHVLWMDKDHHSDTYEQAPMPNAIFFAPGYAIHGASKSQWGHPASHGCVRIPVGKSAILFDMVKAEGADVTIIGYSPVVAPTVASVRAKQQQRDAAAASGDVTSDGPGPSQDPYASPRQRPVHGETLFGSFY